MKRHLALLAILALFVIAIVNPCPYSMPLARGIESNEKPFFTAADGDESSESITSFAETLADDVLFYPDADNAIGFNELSSSSVLNENETDVVWNDPGPIWWRPYTSGGYSSTGGASNSTMIEMWGYKSTPLGPVEIEVGYYLNTSIVLTNDHLFYIKLMAEVVGNYRIGFYNGSTEHYTSFFPIAAETWTIITALDLGDIVTGTVSRITVENDPTASYGAGANHSIWVDYHHLTDIPVDTSADIYAESFADVSEWALFDDEGAESLSTDGDVATFVTEYDGVDDDFDYIGTESVSVGTGVYLEIRVGFNISVNSFRIYCYESAGYSGDYYIFYPFITVGMSTFKAAWDSAPVKSGSPSGIESIKIAVKTNAAYPNDVEVEFDCFRIGPADEMGWQHDGSTTAGVTDDGDAGITFTASSDGDKLTLNTTWVSGTYWSSWRVLYDATTTAADIDRDYYPFYELQFTCTKTGSMSTGHVGVYVYYDGHETVYNTFATDGSDVTIRGNMAAETATDNKKYIDFYSYMNGAGDSAEVVMDWVKIYSIANYTITHSGATKDDYLYTDSGVLYSNIDDGYIELNHDPALAVSDTYSIYNLTTSSTAPEFSQYVSEWSAYSDETRGATTSGTVTDIKLKFDSTEIISAIKFWEDATAPDILDKFITPNEPDDDESTTITAVTSDGVSVYEVTINAVVSPDDFSDVDYDMTEQQTDLWIYEFDTLTDGYYLFEIRANDGANTYSEYLPVTVRESSIVVAEISLIGAGSDFTMMQFSARINKDCSYIIYEESENNAESATHSGSVSEPSFNLAWTKLDTTDTNVNFTIKFTNGTLTYNYTSQYQVTQTILQVTGDNIRTTESYAYLSGHVNLNANYTVYEETVQVGTGSVTAGSFEIRWTKASSDVENVTVLFESGSQSYPVYSGYDVAAQVTFVVESWWMDLNLGVESYVEFYVLSSFENATVYVYDNNTLMTTVTESAGGAYSYFWLSESEGLHIITLNITHGATVHTRTRTYYIPDWAATGLVVRWDLWTFQDNYTMLELGSNWMNCTYYIYLNGSLVATSANDPVTLNFTRAINVGEYNLTIHADAGAQTYTIKNIRYIITEEGVSYDYSSVTGGVTNVEGDTYEGDIVTINENPTGVFIDQATAAIVSVGGFLIIFTAFLVARELKHREREKTERTYSQ